MKECPKCKLYTVDFDEYFGRHRCFNASCSWMPPSASERQFRLLERGSTPKEIASHNFDDIHMTMNVYYDEVNDVMVFDFCTGEPFFEYPSDDARISWNVGRNTGQFCGFVVYAAKEFGVEEVHLDIVARIGLAAEGIGSKSKIIAGQPTRNAIEKIGVTLKGYSASPQMSAEIGPIVKEAIGHLAAHR